MLSTSLLVASLSLLQLARSDPTAAPQPTLAPRAVTETTSPLPLTDYTYAYSDIPYQVNPYATGRGPMSGYNQCNSTTEGASSQCQTLIFNNISDFCIWGSATPNEVVGNVEAAMVCYCTTNTHGCRIIPPGALQGVQFMKTSAYIQVTGFIDQTAINLLANDTGGEEDPHGADGLGNPVGSLGYSNNLPVGGNNVSYVQATSWNYFVGGGIFCLKFCDPTINSPNYCQNIYDIIGCSYNMPASYVNNTFLSCEGELQDEAGTYTSNGQTYTWSQPSALPASSTLPWTPRIPASSNCVTYSSNQLYAAVTTSSSAVSSTVTTSAGRTTSAGASSGAASTASSGSKTGTAAATATKSSSAGTVMINVAGLSVLGALAALAMA